MFPVIFLCHLNVLFLLSRQLRRAMCSSWHTSNEGHDPHSTESSGQTWHWSWHGSLQAWALWSWEWWGWFQLELCIGGKRFANSVLWSRNHSFKTFLYFSHSHVPPDLLQTFKILLDASVYFLHLHEFYFTYAKPSHLNTVLCLFPSSSVKEIGEFGISDGLYLLDFPVITVLKLNV